LLFGKISQLPVFSALYHSNLNNVKPFYNTITNFKELNNCKINLILDKNFYNEQNFVFLDSESEEIPLIISVPHEDDCLNKLIALNADLEYDKNHTIDIGPDAIHYRHVEAHQYGLPFAIGILFLNVKQKANQLDAFLYNMHKIRELAEANPIQFMLNDTFNNFFLFERSRKYPAGYKVSLNFNNLHKYGNSGWFVLNSTDINNPIEALKIYRTKNFVEEIFTRFNSNPDKNMPIVKHEGTLEAKMFIDFISLIILSYIHNIMKRCDLYNKYTLQEMLDELNLLNVTIIHGKRIYKPISESQSEIFSCFGCPLPSMT
jgi:transposase